MSDTNLQVEQYMPLVRMIVAGMGVSNQEKVDLDYEDLLQIGYLALIDAVHKYGDNPDFKKIAKAVVRNRLLDQAKYANYRYTLYSDDYLSSLGKEDETLSRAEARLFLEKFRNTTTGTIKKGMQSILYSLNGYSRKEISAMYGVSVNLVGAWISRARKALKKAYLA